ncbi:MAG TPA: UDP-galactopyranose mutase [Caulobacterales bacterium]|nr:UDP-galactopyranose mutase [Caulobacterales bacterium]
MSHAKGFDWLIVGAGFTGATLAERIASELDQKVLLIDRRAHIGGNAYDYAGPAGVRVHQYGPHIFHTNSERVWRYLSRFTEWRPYFHRVLAMVEGNALPLPFSLESIERAFPAFLADDIGQRLVARFGYGARVPVLKLREETDERLAFVARYVYDNVFQSYTRKQWGLLPEELDPGVTARVPISISRDTRYFTDTYQAMPREGYTPLFERMLHHPNIELSLSTDFSDVPAPRARVVFTGPIDEYFKYAHGALPYRSLRFKPIEAPLSQGQTVGTVNYPNEFDFTRITDLRHLTAPAASETVLVEEYPEAYERGRNEPYYPIPTPDTSERLKPYLADAAALEGKVWFAGRLGDYAYYNMDQACARALALFEKKIAPAVTGRASA